MVSSTETTASTSAAGITPPSYPPPGMPPLEPMDTLPAPTSENLLATAGVGRGGRTQSQPRTPTAPGVRQMRPTAPQQWAPTPRRPGKMKTPGVGPHPEGLKANTGETDPPSEDPGNVGEASRVMIPWTRCLTTWPQDGNETSRT